MVTTTGRAIRQEVGRILREKDEKVYWEYVNTGTGTASITDAVNLASTKYSSQKFDNYFVRHSDGTDADPDGAKSRATTLTSAGVLSFSPSITAMASTETGELWHPDFDPDNIDRARDRALSQLCTRWRLTPLSWVIDPDYLVDDLADATPTHWTATAGDTATVTNRSGLERFSERVLRVAAGSTDAYASQAIKPPHGADTDGRPTTWFVGMLAQADSGVATPTLRDVTNSTTLTSTGARTSWSGEAFNAISFTAEAPATCESMELRLGVTDTNGDSYFGPVCVYPVGATEFVLPSRVVNRSRVGLFYGIHGSEWPDRGLYVLPQQPQLIDVGGGQVRAIFPAGIPATMVFYEEYANYGALQSTYNTVAGRKAGDKATTDCPLEYAAWATIRMYLGEGPADDQWERVHQKHAAKLRPRFQRDRVAV